MSVNQFATINPETGKISPSVLPTVGGGGARSVEFAFAGNLTVKIGEFLWISPNAAIRPTLLTASLGQTPSMDTTHLTVLRIRANGSPLATVQIAGANQWAQSTTFELPTLPPNTALAAEVVSLTTHTPVVQAHALLQLWWEYAE